MENNREQPSTPIVKPDLAATIQGLRDGSERGIPTATIFYGLSDLTSNQVAEIKPVWNTLETEFRRKVMRYMAETSETDYEVNYRAFGLFGLTDIDSEVRTAAIDVLFEDESLELMQQLMNLAERDSSTAVRAAAMSALGRFILAGELGDLPENETVKAQALALRLLNDEQAEIDVRRRALEAFSNSSHEAVPSAIKKAYRSSERKMQVSSVFAMGRSCDHQWENIVLEEIEGEDAEIRYEAARAAGGLELVSAVPKLAQLLTEDDEEIKEVVVWSLGEIGGRESLRVLNAMLEIAEEAEDEDMIEAIEDAIGSASLVGGDLFTMLADED